MIYNKIWRKKIKKLLGVEFYSEPVYDEKYIKARVKTFEDKVITKFTDNKVPKENTNYSCIAAICVNSVIKFEKENYPQVNLEQYKFRLNKRKYIDFFDDESEGSRDESEIETEWIEYFVFFNMLKFSVFILLFKSFSSILDNNLHN